MTMPISNHTDDAHNIVVHYDTEATEPATRFVIWFEGNDRHVVAMDGESPAATYERVLASVQDMRLNLFMQEFGDSHQRMSRGLMRGNRHRPAHVYAGIKPTREQVAGHMRQWLTWTLWQLANPYRNDNAMERIAALGTLAELYGLHQPQTVYITLPTREELDAEIARRKTF
jgi:hypothetical protein